MAFERAGYDVLYWKTDEAGAYRQWPIRECDRRHFGRRWLNPRKPIPEYVKQGQAPREEDLVWLYMTVLPFGWVRSVEWYHRVGRALNALYLWEDCPYLSTRLPQGVYTTSRYLDDTLGITAIKPGEADTARPGNSAADRSKARFFELCNVFGIQISLEKDEGEGAVEQVKDFLGVELHSKLEIKRISTERLEDGLKRLRAAAGKAYMLASEFDSLVGVLSFCAQCCPPARTFTRRMYDMQARSRRRRIRPRFVRLNRGCRADIAWWLRAWRDHNGQHFMAEEQWAQASTLGLWTDACEAGYGGGYLKSDGTLEFFLGEWPARHGLAINELELATVCCVTRLWGEHLRGKSAYFHIDNQAAQHVINKGSGRCAAMMVAQREVVLDQLKHGFRLRGRYIKSKDNIIGDSLSRVCIDPSEWVRFHAHAFNALGAKRVVQVTPEVDVEGLVARMARAQRNAKKAREAP